MSPRIVLIAILASGAAICAYLGHLEAVRPSPGGGAVAPWIFVHALTNSMLIFPRGAGVLADSPALLQIARVLALLSAALAAVEFWHHFLFRTSSRVSLRLWRGHFLVCGLGRKGRQLAHGLRAQGGKVAMIEKENSAGAVSFCREIGVALLDGDATDEFALRLAGIPRASAAFIVAGRDQTNLEIAMKMLARYREAGASRPFVCHVHIVRVALLELLQRQPWMEKEGSGFELKFFSIHQNTARTLFQEHPLEGLSPSLPALRRQGVHLVIVGFGDLSEALLWQAAAIAHYPGGRKLRVSVVSAGARDRLADFLHRYPAIDEIVDLQFLERPPIESFCPLAGLILEPGQRTVVVTSMEDDADNLAYALRIESWRAGQEIPILMRVVEEGGINSLLANARHTLTGRDIHVFGSIEQACRPEVLMGMPIDRIARAIHEDYLEKNPPAPGEPVLISKRSWERLPEEFKRANRALADHMDVKLRSIGCERVSATEADAPFAFTTEELEELAETEHRRWVAEKLLAGWKYAEVSVREQKLHACLVSWDRLTNEEKEKDRDMVRLIPDLLAMAGSSIRRN